MAKMTGGKASFKWTATTYQCLNSFNWSGSVQDLVAQCSGTSGPVTQRRPGTPDDKFTFDIILDEGEDTIPSTLKRGATTTTFEAHPEGDTTGNLEFTATSAVVLQSNLATGPNAMGILSLTIGISGDLTIQAAA